MQLVRILLFILLTPLLAAAQKLSITGRVTAGDTKQAVSGASVFLSNSSVGTSTTADGTFTLSNLNPGQYTLVVTAVGYDNYQQTLAVNSDAIKLDITLAPKSIQLNEVKVSAISKSDRRKALARFKTEFIGTDENAADCKIVNPDVLTFAFQQNRNILQASTSDFLIIENNALGYQIKFMLKNYESNAFTGDITYRGSRVFEDLKGGEGKKKRWYKKRDEAYFGSAMHFYRALANDSLATAGFKIYRLARQPNPVRPPDEVIEEGLARALRSNRDSIMFWAGLKEMSQYANHKFKGRFLVKDIVKPADTPGLFNLSFPDHLYVVYTKKWETNYYRNVYRSPNDLNYSTTIISLTDGTDHIVFDKNGTIIANGPFYEGAWSQQRISSQLPVDYMPYGKQP